MNFQNARIADYDVLVASLDQMILLLFDTSEQRFKSN